MAASCGIDLITGRVAVFGRIQIDGRQKRVLPATIDSRTRFQDPKRCVFKLRQKEAGVDKSAVSIYGRLLQKTDAVLQKPRLANAVVGF